MPRPGDRRLEWFYSGGLHLIDKVKLGNEELFGLPKIVPYPYEVNWHLVTENGSLIPICSLSKQFLIAKFDCT